jgi:phosphohistidine phosphatase
MHLYIVRHAWAADRDDSHWPNDDVRPLTPLGKDRFAHMAKKLVAADVTPTIIATSPLLRCVETAEILAAALDKPKIVELGHLRPGSNLAGLLQWTTQQMKEHERIAWVGHAPDVNHFIAALIGDGGSHFHFAKGAAAALRFDGTPAPSSGELLWLATAKLLGC